MGNDLRYTIRTLSRSPLFTAVCILSLGFGLGAASTMFNFMDRVLWRPLAGVAEQDQLAGIVNRSNTREWLNSSYPDYRDYRDKTRSFSGVIAHRWQPVFVGAVGETERAYAQMESGNYFDVLGVKAIAGRTFNREEQQERAGGAPVVVLSERYWARRYGRDPNVLGSTILVNRFPLKVVGVVGEGFQGTIPGLEFEMWIPLVMHREVMGSYFLENRASRPLSLYGRLKRGVSVAEANAEVAQLAAALAREYPQQNEGVSAEAVTVEGHPDGAQRLLREPLYALTALGVVVLLLVCANVGNLLLARAEGRRKEFAIRRGLGASTARLMRQILIESLVLATAGAVLGLLVTSWTGGLLTALVPTTDLPLRLDAALNLRLVGITFGLGLVAAILAAVAPGWRWRRIEIGNDLNAASRGATGNRSVLRWRGGLAAVEIGLATVALMAGIVFWKSFEKARAFRPGFEPRGVVLVGVDPVNRDRQPEEALRSLERTRDQLAAMPGVRNAAIAQHVPLSLDMGSWEVVAVDGYTKRVGETMNVWRNVVSPGFFELMRVPVLEGRDFSLRDDNAVDAEPVAIVNETFARRYYGGMSAAVGRRFSLSGGRRRPLIVGVVKDHKYQTLGESSKPFFYLPLRQWVSRSSGYAVFVRTEGASADAMLEAVREQSKTVDPQFGVIGPVTFESYLGAAYLVQRAAAAMCSVLGLVALGLAAMGTYGVMAYSSLERRREIGIRMALGATPAQIRRMLARGGLVMVSLGLLLGGGGWLLLGPLAGSILFGVQARDASALGATAALVMVAAAGATLWPAWRASRVDPGVALRDN